MTDVFVILSNAKDLCFCPMTKRCFAFGSV